MPGRIHGTCSLSTGRIDGFAMAESCSALNPSVPPRVSPLPVLRCRRHGASVANYVPRNVWRDRLHVGPSIIKSVRCHPPTHLRTPINRIWRVFRSSMRSIGMHRTRHRTVKWDVGKMHCTNPRLPHQRSPSFRGFWNKCISAGAHKLPDGTLTLTPTPRPTHAFDRKARPHAHSRESTIHNVITTSRPGTARAYGSDSPTRRSYPGSARPRIRPSQWANRDR
jgi:hypothetical protein